MTIPSKHPAERDESEVGAIRLTLHGGSRGDYLERLLGDRLVIHTPHGIRPTDRLLIEAADSVPAEHVLTAAVPGALPALALGALRPEDTVVYYHFDLFYVREAEMLAAGHRVNNLRFNCLPDLPASEPLPELILTEFRRDGEAGLTLELIRQAHDRLARGKLLAAIDNPHDQWLRRQLEKTFGNLTLVAREKHGLLYLVKRVDRPASGDEMAPAGNHYVRQIEVGLGDLRLSFETCYGVFSSGGLDEGSRALLEVMAPPEPCDAILDLGCGWGAMGILAARKTGARRLVMIDSNARAVEMARRNAARLGPGGTEARLEADAESIERGEEAGRFDAVIANPPYGTEFRVTDLFVRMAFRALRPGGGVWLVGKNNPALVRRVEEIFGAAEILHRRGYWIVTARRPDTRRYE